MGRDRTGWDWSLDDVIELGFDVQRFDRVGRKAGNERGRHYLPACSGLA